MFEFFDYKYLIQKITVTEETVNQQTGEVTPTSSSKPVKIKGHLSDLTQKELSFLEPALIEKGVRKFATSENIFIGDILNITESDSSITAWNVEQFMNENALFSKYFNEVRKTYLLKRI